MKQVQNLTIIAFAAFLSACGGGGGGGNNNDTGGTPPVVEKPVEPTPPGNDSYPVTAKPGDYTQGQRAEIFDRINYFRTTCGYSAISQNKMLDTAASGHAEYNRLNNTYGHTQSASNVGFTGANLQDRITNSGYSYSKIGEIANSRNSGSLIAGTSASGIETSPTASTGEAMINRLFSTVYHQASATEEWSEMGVGFSQSANLTPLPGETLFYTTSVVNFGIASGSTAPEYKGAEVRSFPCEGITGVSPIFTAELPNPYPSRNFDASPMGTPVGFTSKNFSEILITSATVTNLATGASVVSKIFNSKDDPNNALTKYQAFVIPDQPLANQTKYKVAVTGTDGGINFSKDFIFKTGSQN